MTITITEFWLGVLAAEAVNLVLLIGLMAWVWRRKQSGAASSSSS